MPLIRGLGAAAAVAAIAFAPVLLLPSPAEAARDDAVQVSLDGRHWADRLPDSIFPTGDRVVPGDTLDGTFYVRNGADEPLWLRVGLSELYVEREDLAIALQIATT